MSMLQKTGNKQIDGNKNRWTLKKYQKQEKRTGNIEGNTKLTIEFIIVEALWIAPGKKGQRNFFKNDMENGNNAENIFAIG